MPNALEESLRSALSTFLDFLYAIVYGLILQETFNKIIEDPAKSLWEKGYLTLLILSLFYFLSWDWLHSRRLTLKNPFLGYRRFFMEVIIAFLAYGAALGAVNKKITFVIYVLLGLLMGAFWAYSTLQEYPQSEDVHELKIIIRYQIVVAIGGAIYLLFWYSYVSMEIRLIEVVSFGILGYIFVLFYDVFVDRQSGIIGGPGAPFISRERIEQLKDFVFRR